jgi:hypothetical protein
MGATTAHKVDVYYRGRLLISMNLDIKKGRTKTFAVKKKGLIGHEWSLSIL